MAKGGSIGSAISWMIFLSLLTFWLPVLGPIIAGYVGGKKAGSAPAGFFAAILPGILIAAVPFLIGTYVDLPIIGAILASSVFIFLLIHSAPLILGAIIGGTLAPPPTPGSDQSGRAAGSSAANTTRSKARSTTSSTANTTGPRSTADGSDATVQTEGDRPSDRLPPDAKSTRLAAQLTAGEMESVDDSDGPDLSEDQAFAETNLFVRYASKGRPMLKDVQEGGARADEVYENLRIERHTQFDEPGATVDGRQFREWLFDRSEYRFVVWLLGELSFELLTMSAVDQMRPLYDALPAIDRVEFDASVHLENEVDEVEREVRFNLVAFDRRGNPLVVANFETSRDPVGEDAIASLVSDATVLGNETEHLAGAFFVTESYFEPEAIAPAEEATEGGLLSRDSRASFVKLSRKRGFHLCLVELRDGAFHLVVPDL